MEELTKEEEDKFYEDCENLEKDTMLGGFMRVDFKDYTSIVRDCEPLFHKLVFELTDFGVKVDKKEEE